MDLTNGMEVVWNFLARSWMTSLDWIDVPNAGSFYQWYYGIYTAIASVRAMGGG